MKDSDLLIARAQVGLAFLFAVGFIAVLFVLVFFHSGLSSTANTLLTGLLGVFGTVLTLQQNYFFARQRPPTSADPTDPNTTTTSTTSTSNITTPSPLPGPTSPLPPTPLEKNP